MDHEWGPVLNWHYGTPKEQEEGRHLSHQLIFLGSHVGQFQSAVNLVEHCENLISSVKRPNISDDGILLIDQFSSWKIMAANSAALSIYDFRSCLRSIRDRLHLCPTIARNVDTRMLESTFNQVEIDFPYWKLFRDYVCHFADKIFKPDDIKVNHPEGTSFFHGVMSGHRLVFTHLGSQIYLDVTNDNADRLNNIKLRAYEAFRKASLRPP